MRDSKILKLGNFIFKTCLLKAIIILTVLYVPIYLMASLSEYKTKSDKYAAVMLSGHVLWNHDHWAPLIAYLGSYPFWTVYFNSKGLKVDYIFSATTKDFYRILENDKYQSIVVVGHGTFNSWRATDSFVTNTEVTERVQNFKKKNGEWFNLTCPTTDFSKKPLGSLVMNNMNNVHYYKGEYAVGLDFILDSLTAFSHIKNSKKI